MMVVVVTVAVVMVMFTMISVVNLMLNSKMMIVVIER